VQLNQLFFSHSARYLLSKVEVAQRAVSGVTIFQHVLHLSSASAKAPSNDLTESKPQATAANLPDWEREGRLWSALEVENLARFMSLHCYRTLCIQHAFKHLFLGEIVYRDR
jgi:hypothetical protein